MNYPLKKRRGRPPKYLNIWHNEYIANLAHGEHASVDSKGVDTTSNGVETTSNGVDTTSNGVDNTSNGVGTASNGVTTSNNGVVTVGNGVDISRNGVDNNDMDNGAGHVGDQTSPNRCERFNEHDSNNNTNKTNNEYKQPGTVDQDVAPRQQMSPQPPDIISTSHPPDIAEVRRLQPNEREFGHGTPPPDDALYNPCSSAQAGLPNTLNTVPAYKSDQSETEPGSDVTRCPNDETDMTNHVSTTDKIICDISGTKQTYSVEQTRDCAAGYPDVRPSLSQGVREECCVHRHGDDPNTVCPPPASGHHVQMVEPVVTLQPVKRRPGRPPGSTKKTRTTYPPYTKPKIQDDQFSLRRFFEAGGRDYNEYLDWLKRKNNSTTPSPQTIFPPFYQMPMAGSRIVMTSQPAPGGFQFPSPFPVAMGARSPAVSMASPPIYHPGQLVPVTSPMTSQVPVINREQCTANMTVAKTDTNECVATEQISPSRYNQHTLNYQVQRHEHTAGVTSGPHASDAGALDLSSKRMRSDSDSEKENDYMDISFNKRLRPETEQIEMTSQKLASHMKYGPEVDVRYPGDAIVESSTEGDVTSWNVDQVADFVAKLPECHVYAQTFRTHRIDGATLPHLSDDHLLNHVGMKLGHMIRLQLALSKLKTVK